MEQAGTGSLVVDASTPMPQSLPTPMRYDVATVYGWSLDSDEAFEILGGPKSPSGSRVTWRTSLQLGPVWQALSMISGDVARLPLNLWRRLDDDESELARDLPAYRCCKLRANPEMHAYRFWRRLMVHALLWQNGYAYIARRGNRLQGPVVELLPLLPDRTAPDRIDGQLVYRTEADGKRYDLLPEQVLHIEGLSLDNTKGAELLVAVRDVWGTALARQNFTAKFFKHGGRIGGVLELPAAMPKTARDRVEGGFKQVYETNDAAFRTVVLRDNAKFHAAQFTPDESQMLESRQEDVRDIARFFNIAPARLGVQEGRPYKSKIEDNREYLETTLAPWLSTICTECAMKLLDTTSFLEERLYFEHDTTELLRMDKGERYRTYEIGIRNQFLTPDEARLSENMPRRADGRGGEFEAITSQRISTGGEAALYDLVVNTLERIDTWYCERRGRAKGEYPLPTDVAELTDRLRPILTVLSYRHGAGEQYVTDCVETYLQLRGDSAPFDLKALARSWCYGDRKD